jgi:hypothetical protein
MKRQGLWRCRTLYSRVMVAHSSKARVAVVTAARITCCGPPSSHVVLPSCFLGGGLRAVRPPASCRHEVTRPMGMTCGGKNKTLHAAVCAMRSFLPFGLDKAGGPGRIPISFSAAVPATGNIPLAVTSPALNMNDVNANATGGGRANLSLPPLPDEAAPPSSLTRSLCIMSYLAWRMQVPAQNTKEIKATCFCCRHACRTGAKKWAELTQKTRAPYSAWNQLKLGLVGFKNGEELELGSGSSDSRPLFWGLVLYGIIKRRSVENLSPSPQN